MKINREAFSFAMPRRAEVQKRKKHKERVPGLLLGFERRTQLAMPRVLESSSSQFW